jgi:hypothetical protein
MSIWCTAAVLPPEQRARPDAGGTGTGPSTLASRDRASPPRHPLPTGCGSSEYPAAWPMPHLRLPCRAVRDRRPRRRERALSGAVRGGAMQAGSAVPGYGCGDGPAAVICACRSDDDRTGDKRHPCPAVPCSSPVGSLRAVGLSSGQPYPLACCGLAKSASGRGSGTALQPRAQPGAATPTARQSEPSSENPRADPAP